MKKGQSTKEMTPENGIPQNFRLALFGLFTDSKAMKASEAIEILIRDQQPRNRIACDGTDEFEDGSVYHYECDECPKNTACLLRSKQAKFDRDAYTNFFTKDPATLEAHEVSDTRDVAQIFCDAWIERNSRFFRAMADFIDALSAREKVTRRVSIRDRSYPSTSPYHTAVLNEYMALTIGKEDKQISYAELFQAASNRFPNGIDERTFQRIIKLTGIKLKRGKPGPKPARKKTSGKARE